MKKSEFIFITWSVLALALIYPVMRFINGAFAIFTVIWILIPLLVVLRTRDANRVGFRKISIVQFLQVSALNLAGIFLVALLIEPWSHTYQMLVETALDSQTPDTTFAWLSRFEGTPGLIMMFLYSGFVTLFGEELFFRGWLLQLFKKRWGVLWAVILQALLFTIPNLLASLVLPPLQGVLYFVYSFLAIGVINGWAASRTDSIWPGLFSAAIANLIFVAVLLEA